MSNAERMTADGTGCPRRVAQLTKRAARAFVFRTGFACHLDTWSWSLPLKRKRVRGIAILGRLSAMPSLQKASLDRGEFRTKSEHIGLTDSLKAKAALVCAPPIERGAL